MAERHTRAEKREKDETIDKEIDGSVEPAKRLPPQLPIVARDDPRAHVQPSKQRHPRRPPGP